jgi:hypothetical protein
MPSNDRVIQAYSTESLSPALAMASTTSVFDQSQIGCHFFFESVMAYGQKIGTAEEPVLDRAIEFTGAESWGDG